MRISDSDTVSLVVHFRNNCGVAILLFPRSAWEHMLGTLCVRAIAEATGCHFRNNSGDRPAQSTLAPARFGETVTPQLILKWTTWAGPETRAQFSGPHLTARLHKFNQCIPKRRAVSTSYRCRTGGNMGCSLVAGVTLSRPGRPLTRPSADLSPSGRGNTNGGSYYHPTSTTVRRRRADRWDAQVSLR
jgi:hypothetical protein